MGLIGLIMAVSSLAASANITKFPAAGIVHQLRLSDRSETANILADIFLDKPASSLDSAEEIHSFIYSRFEAFSGPCFPAQDSFCPHQRGFYETVAKHSVVREGYRLQACGRLASDPENVRRALAHVHLLPTDELSAQNLLKAYDLFYSGKKVKESELSRTIQLMEKLQRSLGAERAWQKYLALLCSSVGWQVY